MNLVFLWWFTLGALVGFVAEWIWDWIWFRRPRQAVPSAVEAQVYALTAERNRLQADLRACGERSMQLESELTPLRARVAALEPDHARVGALEAELVQLRTRLTDHAPDHTRTAELESELSLLRTRVVELEPYQARVGALEAELEQARAALLPPPAVTLGAAPVAAEHNGDLLFTMRDTNVQLQDELAATRRALVRFNPHRGDPLIDIIGIGPVYQDRLYAHGVMSFEQLAAMSPERVRVLVSDAKTVGELDTASWIAEARRFVGQPKRDPLIDILGVGPVYEQRLLDAGIFTFAQVGQLSVEQLQAIIKPEAWQAVDFAAWIAEAQTLAQQVLDGTYRKGRY